MRRLAQSILAAMLLAVAATAAATDQPISASKLQLTRSGTKESLTFVSKDRDWLFPAIGSPDDPQTAGAILEIVPHPGTAVSLAMPAGVGKPGWKAKSGASSKLKFENPLAPSGISPVRLALLRQHKQIKITARAFPALAFAPATDSMTIRITSGSLRWCVRFDASTIRRTDTSVFSAANAPANSLPDCSDATIGLPSGCSVSAFPECNGPCPGDGVCVGGLGTCSCVPPPATCGSSAPACNGPCADGESCHEVGLECICLPDGAPPCGTPGVPTCGGACPSGEVCRPIFFEETPFHVTFACGCGLPSACSAGGGIECGPGAGCGPNRLTQSTSCLPILCDEASGQPCGDGGVCSPISGELGVCAQPAPCCDGGFVCPTGQSCPPGPTCGCQ